uniref:Uncharacterized protein n=1 Tax=Physcomitrium patens TaxID=3218 RepID=A0A7I4EUU0_PHYPA
MLWSVFDDSGVLWDCSRCSEPNHFQVSRPHSLDKRHQAAEYFGPFRLGCLDGALEYLHVGRRAREQPKPLRLQVQSNHHAAGIPQRPSGTCGARRWHHRLSQDCRHSCCHHSRGCQASPEWVGGCNKRSCELESTCCNSGAHELGPHLQEERNRGLGLHH